MVINKVETNNINQDVFKCSADYIIPVCNFGEDDFEYRVNNLKRILKSIPSYINVIMIEQVLDTDIPTYHEALPLIKEKHIVHYPIFNKPWLLNIGAKLSLTDNLIFADADIFADTSYYDKLSRHIQKKKPKWFIAWSKLSYFDSEGKLLKIVTPKPGGPEGGIVYFKKYYFWKIGGHNEWMFGLGGMDNEIIRRAQFFDSRYRVYPASLTHLWHPYNNLKKDRFKNSKHIDLNKSIFIYSKYKPYSMIQILCEYKNTHIGNNSAPLGEFIDINNCINISIRVHRIHSVCKTIFSNCIRYRLIVKNIFIR
jgi:predicted glycosyltransferase involved in capsule biosynthesis